MTDITELAQREKFEAWLEGAEALPLGYLKNRRASDSEYLDPSITDMWAAWKGASAELVEALEKAQRANAAQDDHINQQQDRIDQLEKGCRHAAKRINSWRRLAKRSIAEQEKCVDELDAARQRIVELDRKNSELDSLTQRWAVERAENAERIAELDAELEREREKSRRVMSRISELESRAVKLPQRHSMLLREDFNEDYHTEMAYKADEVQASPDAAGIKVEAE